MKPICVPCQRFYRPKQNGFSFIEGMPIRKDAPKGAEEPEAWVPYKLWRGDLWVCQGCGSEIIVGTGVQAVAEHFENDFEDAIRICNAKLQVNDC